MSRRSGLPSFLATDLASVGDSCGPTSVLRVMQFPTRKSFCPERGRAPAAAAHLARSYPARIAGNSSSLQSTVLGDDLLDISVGIYFSVRIMNGQSKNGPQH